MTEADNKEAMTMTAEELWEKSGIDGEYEAWAFGDDADRLAELVKTGIKTATLEYWRSVHREFFSEELKEIGKTFDEGLAVVCEEFEVV